jgi:hypothetical protein
LNQIVVCIAAFVVSQRFALVALYGSAVAV